MGRERQDGLQMALIILSGYNHAVVDGLDLSPPWRLQPLPAQGGTSKERDWNGAFDCSPIQAWQPAFLNNAELVQDVQTKDGESLRDVQNSNWAHFL